MHPRPQLPSGLPGEMDGQRNGRRSRQKRVTGAERCRAPRTLPRIQGEERGRYPWLKPASQPQTQHPFQTERMSVSSPA